MKKRILYLLSCIFAVFIASLLALSDFSRIDIHSTGDKDNYVVFLKHSKREAITLHQNENGQNVTLKTRNYWFWQKKKIVLRTVGKGRLSFVFMGEWYTVHNKRPKINQHRPIIHNGSQTGVRTDVLLYPQMVDYKSAVEKGFKNVM